MTDFKPTSTGLRLDAPSPGDIVTVKVKHRPKTERPAYGEPSFGLLGRDTDEADNPQHYRMTSIFRVLAVNGGQAVVERLTGYDLGRREVWPIALHEWFEAGELYEALTPPPSEAAA